MTKINLVEDLNLILSSTNPQIKNKVNIEINTIKSELDLIKKKSINLLLKKKLKKNKKIILQ
jgi:hypothetical protein